MDPITFIIIAAVLYAIFRPKNKPERTAGPTIPPQQYPQQPSRQRGIFADLEDMLREAQGKTEEAPVPRRPADMRPASEIRTASEVRSASDIRTDARQMPAAKTTAARDDYGGQEPQPMHKNAADGKGLLLGRASIVQGFIWSEVLEEPVSRRSPRLRRRVT